MLMATWLNAVRDRFRRSSKLARRPQTQRQRLGRAAGVEALESRLYLAAVTWDAGGDGVHWSDANNWSSDVLAGAADDVTINFGSGTVQHDTGTDTVNSLTTTNMLSLSGGTLAINGPSAINNDFTDRKSVV